MQPRFLSPTCSKGLSKAYFRAGAIKACTLRQQETERGSTLPSQLYFWLMSLMTTMLASFRCFRYSFSYFSRYSVKVARIFLHLCDCLKLSQCGSLKGLFLMSTNCLMSLMRCLKRTIVTFQRVYSPSGRYLLFWMRQYMNLQKSSWLVRIFSLMIQNLSTLISLSGSMEAKVEPSSLWVKVLAATCSLYTDFFRPSGFSVLFFLLPSLYSFSRPFSLLMGLLLLLLLLILFAGLGLAVDLLLSSMRLDDVRTGSLKLWRLTKFLMLSQRNSYFCIRVLLSTEHILLSKNLILEDSLYFSGMEKGVVASFLMSSFQLLHYQGVTPTNNSQYITPTAKMSLYGEQIFFRRDSIGMQRGVPTFCRVLTYSLPIIEKPKSAIFHTLSLLRILAGLMSLWMTPICRRYLVPSITSAMIAAAAYSLNFPFLVMNSSMSPPLHSSVTRQVWVCVLYTQYSLMMLGWLRFLRISISFSSISSPEGVNLRISMTLTATSCLSFPTPLQT